MRGLTACRARPYKRARAAGATVARELRDEDYGSRGFTVRDPDGVYWSFGTYAVT